MRLGLNREQEVCIAKQSLSGLFFSDPAFSLWQSVLKGALGSCQNSMVFLSGRQDPPPTDTGALPFSYSSVRLLRKFLFLGAIVLVVL